jgi:hypothetical protein
LSARTCPAAPTPLDEVRCSRDGFTALSCQERRFSRRAPGWRRGGRAGREEAGEGDRDRAGHPPRHAPGGPSLLPGHSTRERAAPHGDRVHEAPPRRRRDRAPARLGRPGRGFARAVFAACHGPLVSIVLMVLLPPTLDRHRSARPPRPAHAGPCARATAPVVAGDEPHHTSDGRGGPVKTHHGCRSHRRREHAPIARTGYRGRLHRCAS